MYMVIKNENKLMAKKGLFLGIILAFVYLGIIYAASSNSGIDVSESTGNSQELKEPISEAEYATVQQTSSEEQLGEDVDIEQLSSEFLYVRHGIKNFVDLGEEITIWCEDNILKVNELANKIESANMPGIGIERRLQVNDEVTVYLKQLDQQGRIKEETLNDNLSSMKEYFRLNGPPNMDKYTNIESKLMEKYLADVTKISEEILTCMADLEKSVTHIAIKDTNLSSDTSILKPDIDIEAIYDRLSMHPIVATFVEKHPNSEDEIWHHGGDDVYYMIKSNNASLLLTYNEEMGNITSEVYSCTRYNRSTDSVDVDVISKIGILCNSPEDTQYRDITIPVGNSVRGCERAEECFLPPRISMKVGSSVVWVNGDTSAHTVTSGIPGDENSGDIFDSGLLISNGTFSTTFEEQGEFPYYCIVHPWMTGSVIIE